MGSARAMLGLHLPPTGSNWRVYEIRDESSYVFTICFLVQGRTWFCQTWVVQGRRKRKWMEMKTIVSVDEKLPDRKRL